MKIQPVYNSKIFKKGLEFAAKEGALFTSAASLVLSTAVRPAAILAAPNVDTENKQYAAAKSISSSLGGFLLMFMASNPIARAVKKIDNDPAKYIKKETQDNLKAGCAVLQKSGRYSFATQLFKLGIGLVVAAPKAALTCAIIPPVMSKFFPGHEDENYVRNKNIPFSGAYNNGVEHLSKWIGRVIDTPVIQNAAKKYHNTNYEQHLISLTDAVSTAAFIRQTNKSKGIKEERKKALICNAGMSTAFCIGGTYGLSRLLKKSTDRFIEKFTKANKSDPKLAVYVEGIRVAKPALIMGGLYYIAIPLISTFLADCFDRRSRINHKL